jgi:ABC-2 type transport system permease protein
MAAMSVVMWLQVMVWVGSGLLLLNRGAEMLNMARFTFPPGFLVWGLLFLIFGYLLFASVTAAAGAIAPNAREAGQVTWLLVLPLLPTLMFGQTFLEDPNGALSVALSLFPFSAPSAMVTRLAVAQVPLWQILASRAGTDRLSLCHPGSALFPAGQSTVLRFVQPAAAGDRMAKNGLERPAVV